MTIRHRNLSHYPAVHTPTEVFERAKAAIIPLLSAANIATVTVSYDGGGDEGSVHDIAAYRADNTLADLPEVDCQKFELNFNRTVTTKMVSLEAAVKAFADTALEALHGGWENGEGAFGELVIDVAVGSATLDHSDRYVSYETTNTEL